jgi:N-acetylglucosaminyl-diphospho-decaprenol L-rhamnosyltransferase
MNRMRIPELDIVIVDYNSGNLVHDCLLSMASHLPRSAVLDRVVVVDNASHTVSDYQEESADLPLHIIRNPRNRGFAAACNQGAADSVADYLLFLNPDTRLIANSLDAPIRFMEIPNNLSVGIVGIQLLDDEGRLTKTCSYYPRLSHFVNKALGLDRLVPGRFVTGFMSDWDHTTNRRVDVVMGAFYLVRRSLFESLGGFDERFFVYFEEGEFALRARLEGYETYYLAEAQAYHCGCGSSEKVKAQRLLFSWQSRIRYGYKHYGWIAATLLLFVTLFLEPVSRLVVNVAQGSRLGFKETLRGYLLLWRSLPMTLRVK